MAFTKRRKQPHLFRDPSVHPTKQVRLMLESEAANVKASTSAAVVVTASKAKRPARKRAKR
jgi:hypothetical protein